MNVNKRGGGGGGGGTTPPPRSGNYNNDGVGGSSSHSPPVSSSSNAATLPHHHHNDFDYDDDGGDDKTNKNKRRPGSPTLLSSKRGFKTTLVSWGLCLRVKLQNREEKRRMRNVLLLVLACLTLTWTYYVKLDSSSSSSGSQSGSGGYSKVNDTKEWGALKQDMKVKPRIVMTVLRNTNEEESRRQQKQKKWNIEDQRHNPHDERTKTKTKTPPTDEVIKLLNLSQNHKLRYPSPQQQPGGRPRTVRYEKRQNKKQSRPPEPWEDKQCKAMESWQKQSFLNCNNLHEYDINQDLFGRGQRNKIAENMEEEDGDVVDAKLVNNGYFRDVWMVRDSDGWTRRAMKTLRYKQNVDGFNTDRHRRDALAMERLTSSPHIVNIYGFCGNSGLFEYSPGGDIGDAALRESTSSEDEENDNDTTSSLESKTKLRMAVQAAIGVADTHGILGPQGYPTMAHTDIQPGQFILIDGFYKLNDFNRVRFIRWNEKLNEPCTYTVGNNPGEFRSPEEYRYDGQTEAVDVYSLGNVFFVILAGRWPFEIEKWTSEDAQEAVMEGKRPRLPDRVQESEDPVDMAIMTAMDMCFEHEVRDRATAMEVRDFLLKKFDKIYGPYED